MRRRPGPWLLYALALVLGLGAMGWITLKAVRSERAEQEARRRADLEEKVRLALWRMDSTMALFLLPEAARPWSDYEPFHAPEPGLTRDGRKGGRGDLVPSPLLLTGDWMVLLRFQIDRDGRFTSPLVPGPRDRELARAVALDPGRSALCEARLREVQGLVSWDSVRADLARHGGVLLDARQRRELQGLTDRRGGAAPPGEVRILSPFQVSQGSWTAFWVGDRLLMARQVWVGDRELLQACWLDWQALKEVLMSTIRENLPQADLVPAEASIGAEAGKGGAGRLSSLPVRLLPGPPAKAAPGLSTPSRAALLFGWLCALAGALAGAFVLHRATVQGERRGAFASAVAHELRTPLTTFRLYTDLLAQGMVSDPAEQAELHRTLASEAERLDHLVKNVLAYARLEAGREVSLEDHGAGELLDRMVPRLEARAAQAGLALDRAAPPALRALRLRTDALMVEQILFNLVDNACKYAVPAAGDGRVGIALEAAGGRLAIRVSDSGPGIPPDQRRRLFRPFGTPGPREARRAPGVGLGLALGRRLARILGGDLAFEAAPAGATFVLTLPVRPAD
ncbi:MAG: HAMP domain-containing sensor histidine kinase [Holophagaceae bacterium]